MGTPATLPSFVRAGAVGADELANSDSIFLKIKAGKPIQIVPLTDVEGIISFNQHALWLEEGSSPIFPCFGVNWCPGEIIGDKPKFKALLLCVTTEEPDKEMILPMGIGMFKQIVGVSEAIGTIKGQIIRITRTGEKLNTKYTVMPTSRKAKLAGEPETNLLEHLGETDPDVVVEMLEKAGLWTEDHQMKYDARRKAARAAEVAAAKARKAAAAMPVIDVDDEDEEEEILVATPAVEAPIAKKKVSKPVETPEPAVVEEEEIEDVVPPIKPAKKVKPVEEAIVAPVDDDFEEIELDE